MNDLYGISAGLVSWPLVGAVLVALSAIGRKEEETAAYWGALCVSALELLMVLHALRLGALNVSMTDRSLAYVFQRLGILVLFNPVFKVDGLSALMVLLTALLTVCSVLCSRTEIRKAATGFYVCLLFLEFAVVGTFLAGDLLLFYLFWELMLIPLYFLIGVWGSEDRVYATIKFVLFTLLGSFLMLVGILVLYFQMPEGSRTFDAASILRLLKDGSLNIAPRTEMWLFLSLFFAFAIKVPLWPLHTWLPDAHTEAPTAGSVMLAGVLLKTGVYGVLRFCIPLFPGAAAAAAPAIMTLSIVAIIYGALTAMAQKDMKRLVAYSSVSHMGFVMLGVFAAAVAGAESLSRYATAGAMLQMLNHGVSTGALFMLVGVVYERRHTRLMSEFGGLAQVMPRYAVFLVLFVLSSAGLPGLNGFVGEFLILLGAFKVAWFWGALGATGVILGAVYLLIMVQRTLYGPLLKEENRSLRDLSFRETLMFVPLLLLAFWIGWYPKPFLKPLEASAIEIMSATHGWAPPDTATRFLNIASARK